MRDEPLDRDVCRHVHHDDRGEPATTGFHEQRDIEDDDVVGVLLGRDPLGRLGAHRRVHDLVERLQRLWVVEHDRRERGPVEAAVAVEDACAEPLDDRHEHGLTWLLQLSCDRVGVDHHRAMACEQARDRRLPRSDAPGEADQDHPACATTSPLRGDRPWTGSPVLSSSRAARIRQPTTAIAITSALRETNSSSADVTWRSNGL